MLLSQETAPPPSPPTLLSSYTHWYLHSYSRCSPSSFKQIFGQLFCFRWSLLSQFKLHSLFLPVKIYSAQTITKKPTPKPHLCIGWHFSSLNSQPMTYFRCPIFSSPIDIHITTVSVRSHQSSFPVVSIWLSSCQREKDMHGINKKRKKANWPKVLRGIPWKVSMHCEIGCRSVPCSLYYVLWILKSISQGGIYDLQILKHLKWN